MAAFDPPWLDHMSAFPTTRLEQEGSSSPKLNLNPPTVAAFSPATLSHTSTKRSTILVHQKSPLLIATPPQITRALAYSHPFLLPLNNFVGLLTWTTGDPWESFLLVAGFWAIVLYGGVVMRWAGPVVIIIGLMLGLYSRRYSPLSSTAWVAETPKKGHKKVDSEATNTKHQKTLDEMVETLRTFTGRCNILLDPLLELTDFLSTQRTATTATTRPALTTLLIRILLITPLWFTLTLPPIQIITTKRMAIVTGTIFLTWHSRPNRVARALLWRSAILRQFCSAVTGLHIADNLTPPRKRNHDGPPLPPRKPLAHQEASVAALAGAAKRRPSTHGVKFTFILYENQRRWLGLGWTTSLFAYERGAWTDEHLNNAPAKEDFELPDVDDQLTKWRWVFGSKWLVEGAGEFDEGGINAKKGTLDGGQGWIYYDSKWQNGRRGYDGWGRYTRRRKWYRDAELVEVHSSTEVTPSPTPIVNGVPDESPIPPVSASKSLPDDYATSNKSETGSNNSSSGAQSKARGFGGLRKSNSRTSSKASDEERPPRFIESDWAIGDEARMNLE